MKNLYARLAKATKKPTQLNSPRNSTSVFFTRTLFFKWGFKSLLLTMTLLVFCSPLLSKNLNLLFNDTDGFFMGIVEPVLINEYIIFKGRTNGQDAVWSLNTDTNEKQIIFAGVALTNRNDTAFQKLGSDVYFVGYDPSDLATDPQLWKTDGTVSNTELAFNESSISSYLYQNNGYLFGENEAGDITVTDGIEQVDYNLSISNMNSTCIININHIVVQIYDESGNRPFIQAKDGESRILDITSLQPPPSLLPQVLIPQITSHNDSCVIIGSQPDLSSAGADLWQIDTSGDLNLLNNAINDESVFKVMSHQNRLYAHVQGAQSRVIKRFSEDLGSIDAVYGDPSNSFPPNVLDMKSIGDFIAISNATDNVFSLPPSITFANSDLTEIPNAVMYADFGSSEVNLPDGFHTSDGTLIKTNDPKPQLIVNPFQTSEVRVNLPDDPSIDVITDLGASEVYVKESENVFDSKLFILQDIPNIGPILTGSWFVPNIENQGLNIIVGTRANGSQYVNLTGYTYRDGLPLWFAGNTDVIPPQANIDIEMYEFSGIGMFEAGVTPNRNFLGTVNLALTGCNSLNANIDIEGTSFQLSLLRIDDETNTADCID